MCVKRERGSVKRERESMCVCEEREGENVCACSSCVCMLLVCVHALHVCACSACVCMLFIFLWHLSLSHSLSIPCTPPHTTHSHT
jgi:hypothetical protein